MMLTGEEDKYKAFNKDNEGIVWETFYDMINYCKSINKDIIIANTNCNLTMLKTLIDIFEGCEIEFIIIDTPKSICISRLPSNASHMIEIIDKMESQMKVTCEWLNECKMEV